MNPITGLNLARIVLGAVALVSPALAAKIFRLDPGANPQLGYMSRMFGAREVALGAVTLAASGTTQRNLVLVGMAVDATDAFSGTAAGIDGSVTKATSGFLTLPAVGAVVAGAAALVMARR
ncbi:DUF4267 domain-containing protein [Nocardioides sp. Root140]|uniref:DUF4267 domain-containing protein n=1 Tax=Nocardioides sp. Root140 TaxID=1736460 RepID=UPI0006FF3E63|nr:DUF4267 domain-containing protein [Nocardioides sp. Root140]KQY64396.1 hypothetical protein ASD30_05520 [Nocardioides sp. Root140]